MIKENKYLFIITSGIFIFTVSLFIFIDKSQNKENVLLKPNNSKFEFPLFEKEKISVNFFTPLTTSTKINNIESSSTIKLYEPRKEENINDNLPYQNAFVLEPIISPVEPLIQKDNLPQPELSAKSYVIYDVYNKIPLAIKNPNIPLRIASLTKLLVAMVINDFFNLNDIIEVPKELPKLEENVRVFKVDEKIPIYNLIEAMIVSSSNEAALILENYFEDKTKLNFIDQLNKKASDMGMTKSIFSNAVGYDTSENISTIFDLITLAKTAKNYPFFNELANKKQALVKGSSKNYLLKSTNDQFINALNKLLETETEVNKNAILLLKTGTTPLAKENLITSFTYKNREILVIILGSDDRINDFTKVINYLKQFFTN